MKLGDHPLQVYTREGLQALVDEFRRIDAALRRRDQLLESLMEQL